MLNSSSNPDHDEKPAPVAEHDWDVAGWIPDKSQVCDYGYVIKGKAIGCSRQGLLENVWDRADEIKLVWTPDTPEPVFPEKVPLLLDTFRKLAVKDARNAILLGLGLLSAGLVIGLTSDEWRPIYRNLLAVIGAVILIEGGWQLARTRHYTLADAAADAGNRRFTAWLRNKQVSGYTFLLAALVVIVGLFQGAVGDEESIKLAGLVKPVVWQGQVWRLFTACLMHVSIMHFWMNAAALWHLARIVEQTIQRAGVPFVFLFSGLCGSLFSLVLYPHTTSVGASGGLMGLLGFITMAAYFDRAKYPSRYLRTLVEAIVFVGVFGLAGFAFIDNAAHFGGLGGGLLLGWVLLRRLDKQFKQPKLERRLTELGVLSLLVLGLVAATAVWKMGH